MNLFIAFLVFYLVIALEPLSNAHDMCYPQLRIAASAGNSVLRSSGGADLSGHVLSGGGIKRNIGGMERAEENPKRFANNLWSDEYHIYELTWTKFRISISVDGVEYGSTRPGVPFDKPVSSFLFSLLRIKNKIKQKIPLNLFFLFFSVLYYIGSGCWWV